MLALTTLALVMQPDGKIDLTEFVSHAASRTLGADHLATASAGAEKVCVGSLYSLSFLSCFTTGSNNGDE
jgi:hypothetical protein